MFQTPSSPPHKNAQDPLLASPWKGEEHLAVCVMAWAMAPVVRLARATPPSSKGDWGILTRRREAWGYRYCALLGGQARSGERQTDLLLS